MKATFPFAAFVIEKYLSLSIEIAEPFAGPLCVSEMAPRVLMGLLEPLSALVAAGKGISHDQADERLQVHPPKFLIPFELLGRFALGVKKIEYSAVFLVPCEIEDAEDYVYRPVDQWAIIASPGDIHDEPHCLDSMAGVDQSAVKAIDMGPIAGNIFEHEIPVCVEEQVHHAVGLPDDAGYCGMCSEQALGPVHHRRPVRTD